ncbi:MAG TPA: hypothetical protein VNT60_03860 [Deinococcales bacterium]|nr:hypothetical protein [Deinococcales bacterium]
MSTSATLDVNNAVLIDTYEASLGDIAVSVVPAARPLPSASANSFALMPMSAATFSRYSVSNNYVSLNYWTNASLQSIVGFYRSQLEAQGYRMADDARNNIMLNNSTAYLVMWNAQNRPVVLVFSYDANAGWVKIEADLGGLSD